MTLDPRAALESTSWGLGQVMGYNAHSVGFANVEAMVADMAAAEGAQLRAAANFIAANHALLVAFRAHRWERVALHYNGAGYAENHYDVKLAQCHEKYSNPANRPNIETRAAQVCLLYLGYSVGGVDGLEGPVTRAALLAFRHDNGLPAEAFDVEVLGRLRARAGI